MFRLDGKTAIATGAGSGIGLAIASTFAQNGARVFVLDRDLTAAGAAVESIRAAGGAASAVECDVAIADSVEAAFARIDSDRNAPRIDILVNNAGIAKDNLALRMKPEDWEAVLRTNLDGAFHCIQAVLPGMVRQRYGRIINIASVVAQAGNPGQANYIASKAGLIGLTKAIAAEVGSRNITVNAVAPGFIATSMTEKLSEAVHEKVLSMIPLGRQGTAAEVACGVRFLASEEAGYITGHVLNINGGMYMA